MSRMVGRVALLAVLVIVGMYTGAMAKQARFTVRSQALKVENRHHRFSFSYTYPEIRLPGALMGIAGNCRDFNAAMKKRAQRELADFRAIADQNPPRKGIPGTNQETVGHEVLTNTGTFISVRFNVMSMLLGAAHPTSSVTTVNWRSDGTWVTLDNLFAPDSGYLEVLSKACMTDLKARARAKQYDIFPDALAPKADNFKSFAIQAKGLRIFFAQGQVANSFAGVQDVLVPWAVVADKLGPVGKDIQKSL